MVQLVTLSHPNSQIVSNKVPGLVVAVALKSYGPTPHYHLQTISQHSLSTLSAVSQQSLSSFSSISSASKFQMLGLSQSTASLVLFSCFVNSLEAYWRRVAVHLTHHSPGLPPQHANTLALAQAHWGI